MTQPKPVPRVFDPKRCRMVISDGLGISTEGATEILDAFDNLAKENERLRAALEFYCDDANYEEDLHRHSTRLVSQVSLDNGRKARAALEQGGRDERGA